MNRVGQGLIALVVAAFLMLPLLVILPLAFNSGWLLSYPMTGFSLQWFKDLVLNPSWRLAVSNSIIIGLGSAGLATVLGTLAAMGLRSKTGVLYRIIAGIFVLPMIVPIVLVGVGMQITFAPIGLTNGYAGVIIGHAVISVPFVVASVLASLSGINPQLERAAASLGANPLAVFRAVTFPLAMPGVISGAVFALAVSFDEVVVTLFLAGPNQRTVAREIFAQMRDNLTPTIAAVAFIFIIATICVGVLSLILSNRKDLYVK